MVSFICTYDGLSPVNTVSPKCVGTLSKFGETNYNVSQDGGAFVH